MDLQAAGTDPGTQYLPATSGGIPYTEDRQVTLTTGPGTQVYRTNNAQFQSGTETWAQMDTSKPAYTYVQNPDGSIHYYTLDTTTGGSYSNLIRECGSRQEVAGRCA
jgi:hypothetical protein